MEKNRVASRLNSNTADFCPPPPLKLKHNIEYENMTTLQKSNSKRNKINVKHNNYLNNH